MQLKGPDCKYLHFKTGLQIDHTRLLPSKLILFIFIRTFKASFALNYKVFFKEEGERRYWVGGGGGTTCSKRLEFFAL